VTNKTIQNAIGRLRRFLRSKIRERIGLPLGEGASAIEHHLARFAAARHSSPDRVREFATAQDLEFNTEQQRGEAYDHLRRHWEKLAGQTPMRETRQALHGLDLSFGQLDDTTVNDISEITQDDIVDAEVEAPAASVNQVAPDGVPNEVAAADDKPPKGRPPSAASIAKGKRTKARKNTEHDA
jgi:hypothetical protein